jgi:hypothetical protein
LPPHRKQSEAPAGHVPAKESGTIASTTAKANAKFRIAFMVLPLPWAIFKSLCLGVGIIGRKRQM